MKSILAVVGITLCCGINASLVGQKPSAILNRSVWAARQAAEENKAAEEGETLPVPKPAVMNVDVQIALTKTEQKSFADAKAVEIRKVVDGDPLWLHVKFKTRLGDYVVTTRDPDDSQKLQYTLYAELGPRGDVTTLNQYSIRFSKDDLAANEFKVNLAPGMFGRNKSIPVFLMTSGAAKPGVWNNELRLTNNLASPRALTDNLASTPLTLDLSGGTSKYKKMSADYDSIILRGTTDVGRMPLAGTFYNDGLADLITTRLSGENIRRQKIYFSGDGWDESSSFGPPTSKTRRIFATFTYQKVDGDCFYGVAELTADFDFMAGKYRGPELKILKDLSIPCTEL